MLKKMNQRLFIVIFAATILQSVTHGALATDYEKCTNVCHVITAKCQDNANNFLKRAKCQKDQKSCKKRCKSKYSSAPKLASSKNPEMLAGLTVSGDTYQWCDVRL
jgi:hypothetical protein